MRIRSPTYVGAALLGGVLLALGFAGGRAVAFGNGGNGGNPQCQGANPPSWCDHRNQQCNSTVTACVNGQLTRCYSGGTNCSGCVTGPCSTSGGACGGAGPSIFLGCTSCGYASYQPTCADGGNNGMPYTAPDAGCTAGCSSSQPPSSGGSGSTPPPVWTPPPVYVTGTSSSTSSSSSTSDGQTTGAFQACMPRPALTTYPPYGTIQGAPVPPGMAYDSGTGDWPYPPGSLQPGPGFGIYKMRQPYTVTTTTCTTTYTHWSDGSTTSSTSCGSSQTHGVNRWEEEQYDPTDCPFAIPVPMNPTSAG